MCIFRCRAPQHAEYRLKNLPGEAPRREKNQFLCRSPRLVGSNLAICVELTLIDIALIRCKLLSVGYVLVHGTIRQCVVDDGIDSRKEVAALLKSDGRTLRVVRNIHAISSSG